MPGGRYRIGNTGFLAKRTKQQVCSTYVRKANGTKPVNDIFLQQELKAGTGILCALVTLILFFFQQSPSQRVQIVFELRSR